VLPTNSRDQTAGIDNSALNFSSSRAPRLAGHGRRSTIRRSFNAILYNNLRGGVLGRGSLRYMISLQLAGNSKVTQICDFGVGYAARVRLRETPGCICLDRRTATDSKTPASCNGSLSVNAMKAAPPPTSHSAPTPRVCGKFSRTDLRGDASSVSDACAGCAPWDHC
jgi:hypothetical protein